MKGLLIGIYVLWVTIYLNMYEVGIVRVKNKVENKVDINAFISVRVSYTYKILMIKGGYMFYYIVGYLYVIRFAIRVDILFTIGVINPYVI